MIDEYPVREKHICYYVRDSGEGGVLELRRVVERQYLHNEGMATPWMAEDELVRTARRSSFEASSWIMLEANEKIIRQQERELLRNNEDWRVIVKCKNEEDFNKMMAAADSAGLGAESVAYRSDLEKWRKRKEATT